MRREFDLLLMDLNYARDTTSGREGLDLLERIQSREVYPPIVVMTGWATVGLAVQAMQRGVGDFVEKPWVNSRLVEILEKQIALGRERREMKRHERENELERIEISEKLRLQEQEMSEALSIQMRLLPAEIPQAPGYEIAADWRPARIVGGDYYDVLRFDENTLAFCIADVAGKGMPAALLMSNLQAAVRGLASPSVSPAELCEAINRLLCRSIGGDRFITFFYAVLDIPTGRLRYTNAGHPTPLVIRRDGIARGTGRRRERAWRLRGRGISEWRDSVECGGPRCAVHRRFAGGPRRRRAMNSARSEFWRRGCLCVRAMLLRCSAESLRGFANSGDVNLRTMRRCSCSR